MRNYPHRGIDDANTRVAAYESLLDLFTVISFVLIFVASIYVARSAAGAKDWASASAQNAVSGPGVQEALPTGVVLLVVSSENSVDSLALTDGTTGGILQKDVTADSTYAVLDSVSSTFEHAKETNIAFDEEHGNVNPGIIAAIVRWQANHGYKDWHYHFAGAQ